jgi:AraC family transcriptional regulator
VVFHSPDFDMTPYQDFDGPTYVRRTYCSWDDAGWRSLLVQCFDHVDEAEQLAMPATADLHLVLCVAGDAVMHTDGGDRRWLPGSLELLVPGQGSVRSYRANAALRTIQVHLPWTTVDRTRAELGGRAPDFAALSAALRGDPLVEQLVRALSTADTTNDLYAESAAAFLTTHLLTHGRPPRLPGPEHAAVRAATALMRERLAEPLSLNDIAGAVHLSVYHFARVFRDATGDTPHRFLTRLRVERAKHLLANTDLSIEAIAPRCGFASPGALSTTFLRHVGVRPSTYRKI